MEVLHASVTTTFEEGAGDRRRGRGCRVSAEPARHSAGHTVGHPPAEPARCTICCAAYQPACRGALSRGSSCPHTVLTTWTHTNAVATSEPLAGDQVRRSQFYDASVTPAQGRKTAYPSFVYMSVPRSGNDKIGYTEEDGAEFTSQGRLHDELVQLRVRRRRLGQRHVEDRADRSPPPTRSPSARPTSA